MGRAGDRRQLLVLHLDQLRGVLRQVPIGGDDGRQRRADVPGPVALERELGDRTGMREEVRDRRDVRQVQRGDRCDDTRARQRTGGVDPEPRVR